MRKISIVRRSPLHEAHVALRAQMIAFHGHSMPLHYGSSLAEHLAVREKAGLFDVSHMGKFFVSGADRDTLAFLQHVTTNDVSALGDFSAQYSCLTNEEGKMLDDLLVYKLAGAQGGYYMLVVNAANESRDWAWLERQRNQSHPSVRLTNESANLAILALQGPLADDILSSADASHEPLAYYTSARRCFLGVDIICSATGYTGSGGYELYVPAERAVFVWERLLATGREYGLQAAGLSARDSLRLEMGYCLYGNDADLTTTPLEAGLGWITKLRKGDFIGREALLRQKEAGLTRSLVGFVVEARGVPRAGYPLHCAKEGGTKARIGTVTSGGFSPCLRKGIGMAYVPTAYRKPGTLLHLAIRGSRHAVRVRALPLHKAD